MFKSAIILFGLAILVNSFSIESNVVEFNGIVNKFNSRLLNSKSHLDLRGDGNRGDLTFKDRSDGDKLLLREILILSSTPSSFKSYVYTANYTDVNISTIRFLNIGRQRAEGSQISLMQNKITIDFRVQKDDDPRVLIEIYGYEM